MKVSKGAVIYGAMLGCMVALAIVIMSGIGKLSFVCGVLAGSISAAFTASVLTEREHDIHGP